MVDIVHWNPKVKVFKRKPLNWLPLSKPVNNFGDLLGPMVVDALLKKKGITDNGDVNSRLLTVGSIMHFAEENDTIWGTGVLGNASKESYGFESLNVKAVRGPNTRNFLQNNFSIDVPEVYGDPAILIPELFPDIQQQASTKNRFDLTIVPHFHEFKECKHLGHNVLNPQSPVRNVLDVIARSDFVVASSLHAVILAESFGIPAQLYQSKTEHFFKYEDYYLATGRNSFSMASTIEEAIKLGGEHPMQFNSAPLLEAFPYELFMSDS